MTIETRRATTADLDQLAALFDAYRQFYGRESDLALASDFIGERLANEDSVVFVAVSTHARERLLGFVQLYPAFSSLSCKPIWLLNDLFVAPAQRGEGTGKALLAAASAWAMATGAVYLTLMTATDNAPAQRLYESAGYARETDFVTYNLGIDGR